MFRELRRKRQALSEEECNFILENGSFGVLGLYGDNDFPYTVPVNYVYHENKLYIHSAISGHKIDAIRKNSKASFCVIAKDTVVPEEYTTYFQSVILFGNIEIITDLQEIRRTIELLAIKYYPTDSIEGREKEIAKTWNKFAMLAFSIAHKSGKQAIELVPKKIFSTVKTS